MTIRWAVALLALAAMGQDRPPHQVSERSLERLRFDCASEIDRRDLTLFGNGTLRLRQGPPGIERMWLQELPRERLRGFLNRLAQPARSETPSENLTASGEWVERCVLELRLDGRPYERYEFDRYDTLTLDLQRTVAIARELADRVDTSRPAEGEEMLPGDYQARVGDVLRRADGTRYRVNGFTSDGSGVELIGIEQPLTLYVARTELASRFVALDSRER
ncbi:MAG TPA: hypothetical protein VMV46_17560 [Thermoanaerobaculia bacterium]|nr:hypothetical protein [Thermoanaerobaculia bacterium]